MSGTHRRYPRLAGEPVGIPSLQGGEDVNTASDGDVRRDRLNGVGFAGWERPRRGRACALPGPHRPRMMIKKVKKRLRQVEFFKHSK